MFYDPTSEDGPGPGMIINNIVFAFSKRGWLNSTPNQIKKISVKNIFLESNSS